MAKQHAKRLSIEEAARLEDYPPIARRVGKMERSVWIFDQSSPFNLGCAIDVHGDLNEAHLREALRFCQRRHPQLRSLIRVTRKELYFACFDPEEAPEIPLEVTSGVVEDRDKIATEELRTCFDGYRELMIRVRVVKYSADHCSMFITFQHVIGDGFSAANLLHEIIALLGQFSSGEAPPPPEPLAFPPALEAGLPEQFRGLRGLLSMVSSQSKTTGKMRELGDMPSPMRNDQSVAFSERLPVIETFGFTEVETTAFIARAKQERVTVYALLLAITLDTIHPLLTEGEKLEGTDRVITTPVPTNLRPFLSTSVKNDFGLFASTVDLVRKLTDHNDIPQMARDIRAEVWSAMKKGSPQLFVMPTVSAIMDWRLFFPNTSKGIARATKFITNMAKYSSTSITFLNNQRMPTKIGKLALSHARGYVTPSVVGTALFSAVLYNGVLTIHLIYNENQFSAQDAALLKERFREKALSVLQTSGTPFR